MKSIFLSVIVVCALVIAGIGGTFASLSDTEESVDNVVEVGSLDLKVNDCDDLGNWWGCCGGIGKVIEAHCILPDFTRPILVKVENEGCLDGYLYIVFKNMQCYNTDTHKADWYLDIVCYEPEDLQYKPEPELVAEYGGDLAQETLPGIGCLGDNCCMMSHTYVTVAYSQFPLMPAGTANFIDNRTIGTLLNDVKYAGVLPQCGGNWYLHFWFNVPQISESYYGYNYFNNDSPFDHWPTNALMADGIEFDIMFILVDHALTATEISAIEGDL